MRRIRKRRRNAHPDNGTDPFNAPDLDDIWWGFIEDDELDWAVGGATAAIAGGGNGKRKG